MIPGIGPVQARILVEHFGTAEFIFGASRKQLECLDGIGSARAQAIKSFADYQKAEKEIRFIEKYGISPLFFGSEEYPKKLLHCYDPPTLLYFKGTMWAQDQRIVAVIGTRNNSQYGKSVTQEIIRELAEHDVLVLSGLAFGIDAVAHKSAIASNMPTVAVLAHGLDTVYPGEHNGLAKEILKSGGGLITEFTSNTAPDRHNFPTRNRIVAGMCDAVIVVETKTKGGSMITAELANSYSREVFAVPGKITDERSQGCNQLIKNNKAVLFTSVAEMAFMMDWVDEMKTREAKQLPLFETLNTHQQSIIGMLKEHEQLHIDQLSHLSGMTYGEIASALLDLELNNLVRAIPGKKFELTR